MKVLWDNLTLSIHITQPCLTPLSKLVMGVPLRVGLYAASPRFAAGFPLLSLTQISQHFHREASGINCLRLNFSLDIVRFLISILPCNFTSGISTPPLVLSSPPGNGSFFQHRLSSAVVLISPGYRKAALVECRWFIPAKGHSGTLQGIFWPAIGSELKFISAKTRRSMSKSILWLLDTISTFL